MSPYTNFLNNHKRPAGTFLFPLLASQVGKVKKYIGEFEKCFPEARFLAGETSTKKFSELSELFDLAEQGETEYFRLSFSYPYAVIDPHTLELVECQSGETLVLKLFNDPWDDSEPALQLEVTSMLYVDHLLTALVDIDFTAAAAINRERLARDLTALQSTSIGAVTEHYSELRLKTSPLGFPRQPSLYPAGD